MSRTDRETLREWLYREQEGDLAPAEAAELAAALARDPGLAREREELGHLSRLLASESLPVRPGFRHQVMSALPPAGWEAQHPRSWWLAASLFLILAGAGAALVGLGSGRLAGEGALFSAVAALTDLFRSAALAGAGLLAASWKGLGLTLGHVADGSRLTAAALGFGVLCLNLLFLALWRGARRAPQRSR